MLLLVLLCMTVPCRCELRLLTVLLMVLLMVMQTVLLTVLLMVYWMVPLVLHQSVHDDQHLIQPSNLHGHVPLPMLPSLRVPQEMMSPC